MKPTLSSCLVHLVAGLRALRRCHATGIVSTAILATPIIVDVEPPPELESRSETRFSVAMGGGSYANVSRGYVMGSIVSVRERDFRDAGFDVSHHFDSQVELGLRGTWVVEAESFDQATEGHLFWNPYLNLDGSKFGLGLGYVHVPAGLGDSQLNSIVAPPLSGHLRFGSRRGVQVRFSLMESVPVFSSGIGEVGVGFPIGKLAYARTGLVTPVPNEGVGGFADLDIRLPVGFGLRARGNYSFFEQASEYGVVAGISYTFSRPSQE